MSQEAGRFNLRGRVVVITGGGKGIGKVYSDEFARAGASVVAADIDDVAANAVAAHITERGDQAIGVRVDVADSASCEAMAQAVLARYGAIDVLVNNAALMSALPRRSWMEIPPAEWDSVMAVNLRGIFLCCRAVFPTMQKRGYVSQDLVKAIDKMKGIEGQLRGMRGANYTGEMKAVGEKLSSAKKTVRDSIDVSRDTARPLTKQRRDDMRNAMDEAVPTEFKDWVKEYYKSLSQ